MHTYWVRANAVFFYGLNVLMGMACVCWLSCQPQDLKLAEFPLPTIERLELRDLISLRSHAGVDRAVFSFDLKADLSPLFHWNLKQVFVFVMAEYETERNVLNQIILWDTIVENPTDAHLETTNTNVKYALVDQTNELRNASINLVLVWDHMPLTGRVYMDNGRGSTFTLPASYV